MKLNLLKAILAYLFFVYFIPVSFSQNIDKTKLNEYFNVLEENNKFMGSIALMQDSQLIYSKSTGFTDIEKGIKANPNSTYKIGSISKTFTSVLILKAVELGKLNLEQNIQTFFPTLKNAEKITISHLLNHRSGIHNFTEDAEYLTWNMIAKTEKEMIEVFSKGGNDFEPDAKSEYSNSNYVLLSYILEKTFKKSYGEILEEYISKPLGLGNTYFQTKSSNNNESQSYMFWVNWKKEPITHPSISIGAGGIVSTAQDVAKFSDALFSGKLLKTESLDKMKTLKDNMGYGLFQIPFNNQLGFGHTGRIDGFVSFFVYFPETKISFAMLSNGANYNTNTISIAVLSAASGLPFSIPEFSNYKVSAQQLDSYLGIYSSPKFPLKITITKENDVLIAQATGQESIALEAIAEHIFTFDLAGLELQFNPAEKKMILKQGGAEFTLTKE